MGWIIYDSTGQPLVTQEQHDHTTADASGPMTDDEHDGFSEYGEISTPSTPAANKLRFYPLDGPSVATGGFASVPTFKDSGGADMIFDSGLYTPTLTNGTNVAASTALECYWMRIGIVVCVHGKANIDPTSSATLTILTLTLPIASAFALTGDCSGVGSNATTGTMGPMHIRADVAADEAELRHFAPSAANQGWAFSFMYKII